MIIYIRGIIARHANKRIREIVDEKILAILYFDSNSSW
jgi:hypothetical protein